MLNAVALEPNASLTHAQGVFWLYKALQLTPPYRHSFAYFDAQSIPDWALDAYMAMDAKGLLVSQKGGLQPNEPLTRGDAAMLLWQVHQRAEINPS